MMNLHCFYAYYQPNEFDYERLKYDVTLLLSGVICSGVVHDKKTGNLICMTFLKASHSQGEDRLAPFKKACRRDLAETAKESGVVVDYVFWDHSKNKTYIIEGNGTEEK